MYGNISVADLTSFLLLRIDTHLESPKIGLRTNIGRINQFQAMHVDGVFDLVPQIIHGHASWLNKQLAMTATG